MKINNKDHQKFKDKLKIKNKPGKYDKIYLEKTQSYAKLINKIPGILMVGVGNSTSMNSGSKSSDIDLYIVTKNKAMWFVRFFITIIFAILRQRKTDKKHEAMFCLSFFSTEKGMDFSKFVLKDDVYLYFWVLYFKPIINNNNTYEKFLEINSKWADFSEYQDIIKNNKKYIKIAQKTGTDSNKFLTFVNKMCKKLLIKKTLKSYENLNKPYGIIINDNMLKFHNNDIRKKFIKKSS